MLQREIDPEIRADVEKFEVQLARYLAGDLEEDAFRVFRLNNGIYGQRQGGHNQMLRVKIPYGGLLPHQLDLMADIADEFLEPRWRAQAGVVPGLTQVQCEGHHRLHITTRTDCRQQYPHR